MQNTAGHKAKQSRIWAQALCLDAHQTSSAGDRHNLFHPLFCSVLQLSEISHTDTGQVCVREASTIYPQYLFFYYSLANFGALHSRHL